MKVIMVAIVFDAYGIVRKNLGKRIGKKEQMKKGDNSD